MSLLNLPDRLATRFRVSSGMQELGFSALAMGREAAAMTRQSTLLARDIAPRLPTRFAPGQHLVVLLHGLFATAGALGPLRQKLEQDTGVACASFSYAPKADVPALARRLAGLLSGVPRDTPIHLLGHSLGGIVARYYVQVLANDPRIVQTISLASPFYGTQLAHWLPSWLVRDITPGCQVLEQLHASWPQSAHVPHTSIVATHDQLVFPRHSAAYSHGQVIWLKARGHNALLFDKDAAECVVQCVRNYLAPKRASSQLSQRQDQPLRTRPNRSSRAESFQARL